jgi:hypothetical protein
MAPRKAARRLPNRPRSSSKYRPEQLSQAASEQLEFTHATRAWLDFLARLLAEAALEAHRPEAVAADPTGETTTP